LIFWISSYIWKHQRERAAHRIHAVNCDPPAQQFRQPLCQSWTPNAGEHWRIRSIDRQTIIIGRPQRQTLVAGLIVGSGRISNGATGGHGGNRVGNG
jgi:hypothetical protein